MSFHVKQFRCRITTGGALTRASKIPFRRLISYEYRQDLGPPRVLQEFLKGRPATGCAKALETCEQQKFPPPPWRLRRA